MIGVQALAWGQQSRLGCGQIEQKSDSGEKDDRSASLTIRVPADKFRSAVAGLEGLGTVTGRSVVGQDVTEQYVDVEARLKNKVVLRDRLQNLLDRADAVKDILSIETELNRVQGDIDSMAAQLKGPSPDCRGSAPTRALFGRLILITSPRAVNVPK